MIANNDERRLIARLDDGIELCLTRQKPYFLPFMSERKQALLLDELKRRCFENYMFYAGYESGERKMLGLFYGESNAESFPIAAIEFRFSSFRSLSHRDFLGALMSLGIEREAVGDILVEDNRAAAFVKSELESYIKFNISKIGGTGVEIFSADFGNLPKGSEAEEKVYAVSSLRLDVIAAAVCGLSRSKSKEAVLSGDVCVNYREEANPDALLGEGDVFTIRGKGKFVFKCVLGTTRKGRTRITVVHFR